ncbi:MAG: HlyC/CorC family transporter [Spirochaetes bacterium]|nr:HlyC/CorC family transporter [Spirochaetota bacterium]
MTGEINALMILAFMVLVNGLFSMSEMAVVSSRKQRLKAKADEGHASYRAVLELAESPTSFLSTIQIGITLIGILAGAYGEETVADSLTVFFSGIPWAARYSHLIGSGIVVVSITFVTILLGELIPKRIALAGPERIASLVVYPMRVITLLFLPLARPLTAVTNMFMSLLGRGLDRKGEPPITGEEFKVMIQEGEAFGLFKRQQAEMVESVMDLHDDRIASIMSPRPEIRYVEITEPARKIRERIIEYGDFAYLPVCRNGLDTIVGVIKTRNVLRTIISGEYRSITRHIQKPVFAPESISPLKLLELLKSEKSHVAFVIDEYGVLTGMATMHDIIEEIVGEVPEAQEDEIRKIVPRKDGSFLVEGMLSAEDFTEHFGLDITGSGTYNTLAGFIIEKLGHIPKTGERLQFGGHTFEVVDLDGNRIDKVLVKKRPSPTS